MEQAPQAQNVYVKARSLSTTVRPPCGWDKNAIRRSWRRPCLDLLEALNGRPLARTGWRVRGVNRQGRDAAAEKKHLDRAALAKFSASLAEVCPRRVAAGWPSRVRAVEMKGDRLGAPVEGVRAGRVSL